MKLLKCAKTILNSVQNNSKQENVIDKIKSFKGQSILYSTSDISVAIDFLKILLQNTLCLLIVLLMYLLFKAFIFHGYLPADFMRTAMGPIVKNKTGDTSDTNNYKHIALVTAASKLFEICILDVLAAYLIISLD